MILFTQKPYKRDAMRDFDRHSEQGAQYSHEFKLRPIEGKQSIEIDGRIILSRHD